MQEVFVIVEQQFARLQTTVEEAKRGVVDALEGEARLPSPYISRTDHLTSYVQVVTDSTQELCELILSSFKDTLKGICKSGECISHYIPCLTSHGPLGKTASDRLSSVYLIQCLF